MPAAHSDGDTIVWFRHADVIATGDIFMTTTYPIIDVAERRNDQRRDRTGSTRCSSSRSPTSGPRAAR